MSTNRSKETIALFERVEALLQQVKEDHQKSVSENKPADEGEQNTPSDNQEQ